MTTGEVSFRGLVLSLAVYRTIAAFGLVVLFFITSPGYTSMEAERINRTNNLCDDLAHRLCELRGYL